MKTLLFEKNSGVLLRAGRVSDLKTDVLRPSHILTTLTTPNTRLIVLSRLQHMSVLVYGRNFTMLGVLGQLRSFTRFIILDISLPYEHKSLLYESDLLI